MTFKQFLIKKCTETHAENFPTGFDRKEIHELVQEYTEERVHQALNEYASSQQIK